MTLFSCQHDSSGGYGETSAKAVSRSSSPTTSSSSAVGRPTTAPSPASRSMSSMVDGGQETDSGMVTASWRRRTDARWTGNHSCVQQRRNNDHWISIYWIDANIESGGPSSVVSTDAPITPDAPPGKNTGSLIPDGQPSTTSDDSGAVTTDSPLLPTANTPEPSIEPITEATTDSPSAETTDSPIIVTYFATKSAATNPPPPLVAIPVDPEPIPTYAPDTVSFTEAISQQQSIIIVGAHQQSMPPTTHVDSSYQQPQQQQYKVSTGPDGVAVLDETSSTLSNSPSSSSWLKPRRVGDWTEPVSRKLGENITPIAN